MKVIGFAQLRNELEKGNLTNWFRCMTPLCDFIYIFDQNSIDDSLSQYKKYPNTVVIESPTNRFTDESRCKQELLRKIKTDHPDATHIFWMDGDTLVDGRLLKNDGMEFKTLCDRLSNDTTDAYSFGHKNLWRSDVYERLDDSFDWLDHHGVCSLWKFSMDIAFDTSGGLHRRAHPQTINTIRKSNYSLVHRGFATDYQIITKYEVYKGNGQTGWALERLLDEKELVVRRIPDEMLPDWFEITDEVDPKNKRKIREIYNELPRD